MGRRKKNDVNCDELPPGCKKLFILLTRLTNEDIARYTSSTLVHTRSIVMEVKYDIFLNLIRLFSDQNKQPVTNSWNETYIKQEPDDNEPSTNYKNEYVCVFK